jgi:uncharacterized protein YjbI with pentapeptide repeats
MANPEHLAILKEGPKVWNDWRKTEQIDEPDLSKTNLLHEAKLVGFDLSGVDFRKSALVGARIQISDLSGADLTDADLSMASCEGVSFVGAKLLRTNFNRAYVSNAVFGRKFIGPPLQLRLIQAVNLTNSDWSGATLSGCVLSGIDLSSVRGLQEVKHRSPSSIDIDTLVWSNGKIPDEFLRGCGLPDTFIAFQKSLVHSPFELYSCFISYSTKDQRCADRLYADLQNMGVRCWLATEDLKIGDRFRQRIDESIRFHDKLLLILSEPSVNSLWVQDEVEAALERERRESRLVLFPIRIDYAIMDTDRAWAASIRRTRHIGDFSNWKDPNGYQRAFQRLLRDLKQPSRTLWGNQE